MCQHVQLIFDSFSEENEMQYGKGLVHGMVDQHSSSYGVFPSS